MSPFGDVMNALAFASYIRETRALPRADSPRRPRAQVTYAHAIVRRLATALGALRA